MLRMRVQRAMQLHAAAQVGNPRGCVGRGRRTVGVRADKVQPYRRRRQAGSQGTITNALGCLRQCSGQFGGRGGLQSAVCSVFV